MSQAILGIDSRGSALDRSQGGDHGVHNQPDVTSFDNGAGLTAGSRRQLCPRSRALELSFSIVRRGYGSFIGGASERDRLYPSRQTTSYERPSGRGCLRYTSASWVKTLTLLTAAAELSGLVTHRLLWTSFRRNGAARVASDHRQGHDLFRMMRLDCRTDSPHEPNPTTITVKLKCYNDPVAGVLTIVFYELPAPPHCRLIRCYLEFVREEPSEGRNRRLLIDTQDRS